MNLALLKAMQSSPASRVAVGLVSLMVAVLLLSDLFVSGFLPDPADSAKHRRLQAGERIAAQVALALQQHDDEPLRVQLRSALRQDPTLMSAAVQLDGADRAIAGDHTRWWHLGADVPSTLDNLRMPLVGDGRRRGEVQLAFTPVDPDSFWHWAHEPIVLGIALMTVLGFFAFKLYLRRAMRYLDPSAAVPDRVRTAFETLTEGVLVLDPSARVMLANGSFRRLGPDMGDTLIGRPMSELRWLSDGLTADAGVPWQRALDTNKPQLGVPLRLGGVDGDDDGKKRVPRREVVMNCSPINDGFKRSRGCLVTFSDVTELHERTEGLRIALDELHASREEIRKKNEELTLLATRDALTGCLNRRAFLAESERAIAAALAAETPLCCIMCDVDHFKSVNDRFGHGGGDEVLKAVAKALTRGMRAGDLLGRYGGEEFCIVLPQASLEQALLVTERLRADIEANAGAAVRQFADVKVTMSFGIEMLSADTAQFAALVDRADQALYHSKETGRNRVTVWSRMPGR